MAIIITISCGFITGNRIPHIFTISLIGSCLFGALGFLIYTIFEKKVPEFLDFLSDVGQSGFSSGEESDEMQGSNNDREIKLTGSDNFSSNDMSGGGSVPQKEKLKDGKYGDHIVVNNITFKNEPKLMAEAVRTIMAQDDPEVGTK